MLIMPSKTNKKLLKVACIAYFVGSKEREVHFLRHLTIVNVFKD